MNGRMYDPVLGRMLSPDNYVADPLFTQDYNRYTYARNNPLIYTDPDGNNPLLFMMMFKGAFISGIGYLASAITSGNEGGSFSARGFGAALITGAVSAGLSSGIGKFAGGIEGINSTLFQTAAHGVVQGGVAFAQGGSFETGFATGMFGSIAAGGGGSAANMIGSAAFVGGMTTLSGGGSFWRGAAQGGIVAGFNHVMHGGGDKEKRSRIKNWDNSKLALDIGGGVYGSLQTAVAPGSIWLGKNGKYYNRSWGGNQYTGSRSGALKAASRYRWAGRATIGTSILIGGVEAYTGYHMDGGQFGYNSSLATISTAGSIFGGWAGASIGAAIGVWFGGAGAVPDAIIGGFVGAIGGSYTGSYFGGRTVNYYYGR